MKSSSTTAATLKTIAASARRFPSPENYFSGVRLERSALPDNILCFHRSHPVHELLGHEGISGKYDLHDRFVLVHLLREGGTIGIETNLFNLREGDAVLIFPHQLHYYLNLAKRFCWFYITFELPSEAHREVAALRDRPRRLDERSLDDLRTVMTLYNAGEPPDGFEIALALRSLLRSLREAPLSSSQPAVASESESEGGDGDAALVREVKRYIYSNLDGDLCLATIASHVGLSESYLRARFKDHMDTSLWQFILTVRATRAAHLLRTSSDKIADIGAACGFDSQHSFTRAFKRAFGVTPRQYRNRET